MNSPETTLWQSVIIQALRDAAWTPPLNGAQTRSTEIDHRRSVLDRDAADTWFRRAGRHFRKVCSDAGFDPDFIHEAYTSGRIDIAQLRASEETKRARRAA